MAAHHCSRRWKRRRWKSVFAANLAIAYLQEFKQRTLIVDLDLNSLGDQGIILGQNPPKSIVDISKLSAVIDAKSLAPFMFNSPSGFSFIAAPKEQIIARDLDIEGLGRFLKGITQVFPLTVIDCGNGTEPHALRVLEAASAVFMVATADVIVLNQSKRLLSKIQELHFPPEMVQVVINRHSQNQIINPAMIQKNLNRPVFMPQFQRTRQLATAHSPRVSRSALQRRVPTFRVRFGTSLGRSSRAIF